MTSALLERKVNHWRAETAERFAFIVDAADYFVVARKAMLKARHSIYLIGWDFDSRIRFGDDAGEGPEKLGDFILWLADRSPNLEIRLLRWDTGAIKALFRGTTLFTILRWKWHKRITLKLDGAHPLAASHHQKIVVIDDCIAFCGGIDMTAGRWDRREHLDDDPGRRNPNGKPYEPWHDATSAFDGAAARAMGDLARKRWTIATGEKLTPAGREHDCWPDDLVPAFENVCLAIARTRPEMADIAPVYEIEEMYIDLISRAKRWIYAESQYFASRRIAHAIARRLVEADGPEIVIVNPVSTEGWLEPLAMESARARLIEALRRIDEHDRLRVYCPVTANGAAIYVHAKVMVVDDHYLRVGSSNFNNRSLRLDSECDVVVAADAPGNAGIESRIAALRNGLIAEHLAADEERVAARLEESGSLIRTIEGLCRETTGRTLVPFKIPDINGVAEWLADNQILDPEGSDAIFEPLSKRSLFKGWRHLRRKRRK